MSIRLQAHTPPRLDTPFTDRQHQVLEWAEHALDHLLDPAAPVPQLGENLLVLGGPATGKTTLALEIAARAVERISAHRSHIAPIALLTATRERSAILSGHLAHRLRGLSQHVQVKTPTALAFAIAAEHARAAWAPGDPPIPSPELLTGPEQDALIGEILADDGVLPRSDAPGGPAIRRFLETNRATPAFRTEMRDLLTRVEELGLGPSELRRLAEAAAMPLWDYAAQVLSVYRQRVMSAEYRGRYDHATLLRVAIDIIGSPTAPPQPDQGAPATLAPPTAPTYSLIIADDYQDFTLGAVRLIEAMQRASQRAGALFLASPDTASQQYRGGSGTMVARASQRPQSAPAGDPFSISEHIGRFSAGELTLRETFCFAEGARALYDASVQHIGTVSGGYRRRPSWYPQRKILAPSTAGNEDIPAGRGAELTPEQWRAASPAQRRLIRAAMLPEGVETYVAHSPEQEAAEIARIIRHEHLRAGRPLSEFVVLTRTGAYGQVIREQLTQAGIAVAIPGRPQVLSESPACIPLLTVARWALDGHIDSTEVLAVLTSYLGALPVGELLNLQRWLNLRFAGSRAATTPSTTHTATASPSASPSASEASLGNLIIRAIEEGEGDIPAKSVISNALDRLRRAYQAARAALSAGGGPAQVLWEIWTVADVAESWSDLAISGSRSHPLSAVRAEENLDAVMALFRDIDIAVQRSEQRSDHSADERSGANQLRAFLDRQAELDLPEDSIAARGHYPESVQVLTAAAAAGKRWPVVIIAGVNEGMWPSLTPHDATLETAALTDLATGIFSAEQVRALRGSSQALRAQRERALSNELRQFFLAVSRASEKLFLSAVSSDEDSPSILMSFTQPTSALIPEPGQAGLSTASLIAQLRLLLEDPCARQGEREQAADLLAELALAGVRAADPDRWMGVVEVPSGGVLAHSEHIQVRPSAVERLLETPLASALQYAGADATGPRTGGVDPRISGTIFHEFAELIEPIDPHLPFAEALANAKDELTAITEAYLGDDPSSIARRLLARDQEKMVENWLRFARARRANKHVRVLTEYPVLAQIDSPGPGPFDVIPQAPDLIAGPVLVRSRLDRVEISHDHVVILDIKTAQQAPSIAKVADNAQLKLYQFLWATNRIGTGATSSYARGTTLAGAALLYPKITVSRVSRDSELAGEKLEISEGPRARTQPPLEDLDQVRALIWQAAAVLMMERPVCRHTAKQALSVHDCDFPRLCPLSLEGQGILS